MRLRDALRHHPEGPSFAGLEPDAAPKAPGGKRRTRAALEEHAPQLAVLQERLYAEGTQSGATRRVLLVLQGMDTSGKGGTIKHVIGLVNPQGTSIASFKKPTEEELRHHFLWRVRRRVPPAGMIGIFDRSHYEDVLVARVHRLTDRTTIERRYEEINRFEAKLVAEGVTLVKVFLHLSYEEQRARLLARLDDPAKHWKFNVADVEERARWADYQRAYDLALERCSTEHAPWYVVPADHKWYRDWAVGRLLLETLRELDPQNPRPELDVAALEARLRQDPPVAEPVGA